MSLRQCPFKSSHRLFQPWGWVYDNGFIFSVYKDIKKKQDKAKPARLSHFYFNVQAFIFNKTRYEVVKKTIVFKQQPLSLLSFLKHGAAMFKNGRQLLHGLGTQHGDARLSEVGDALEDGRGGEMAACVQDATILVDALHVYA